MISLTPQLLKGLGFIEDDSIQQYTSLVLELNGRLKLVFCDGDAHCLSIFQDGKLIDLPSGVCLYLDELETLIKSLTKQSLNDTFNT